ncbi:hypothetical protein [Telluria aromaticivorans]|uniref:Uncharacterized protein n=1 Tax=Telluria aromaticivorans TaxID=2725995 RepID=A0A7Y2JVI1_9BURK|nr:hypothetical protein [Telluria aromaticivorans]NNG21443.1 hypothetical protein [Telluria aromaticivorans]
MPEIEQLERTLHTYWLGLSDGADRGRLQRDPANLPGLRLQMVELATAAVQLEQGVFTTARRRRRTPLGVNQQMSVTARGQSYSQCGSS